jgi:3-dehydroquinate synthase
MTTLRVELPERSYAIHIEHNVLDAAGSLVAGVVPAGRAMVVIDQNVAETHAQRVMKSLHSSGFDAASIQLEATESNKSLDAARAIYAAMLDANVERGSPLIAIGGGIVGDLAGYVAATFMRGVPLIHVPTTLLAMVDASIGGKTGVNFQTDNGRLIKNLIGAFWQPRLVLIDPETLTTLNDRDFRSGLAECVKHAMIADGDLFEFLEQHSDSIMARQSTSLQTLIERSAALKISIVQHDERELGQRALLNLGHTFAHAIESFNDLDIRHGEAVSIGLCAAAQCSVARGLMTFNDYARVVELLRTLGLPTRLAVAKPVNALMDAMRHDKKIISGTLRLILPTCLGAARIFNDVPAEVIERAWRSVAATDN